MRTVIVVETNAKTGKTHRYIKDVDELPAPTPRPRGIDLQKLVNVLVKAKIIRREDVETEM